MIDHKKAAKAVQHWVETVAVDLNLCPFAKQELINNRVRFQVSDATTSEQLLLDMSEELIFLNLTSQIETSLLIHPDVLQDFHDYNQFLDSADLLLQEMNLEGDYQIASFHPDYQFAETQQDDAANYTNRAPYPLLHIIREKSLERAIAHYPDPDGIPRRNIALLNQLGKHKMQALLQACFDVAD